MVSGTVVDTGMLWKILNTIKVYVSRTESYLVRKFVTIKESKRRGRGF